MRPSLLVALFCTICGVSVAGPLSLFFVPSTQFALPGQEVSVDVLISGIEPGAPPSAGAFDLDIGFAPAVLQPVDLCFGLFLGDAALGEALTSFAFSPGVANLAEVSLLSPEALMALQPESFMLATLSFKVIQSGTSPLTFSRIVVDDAFGQKLSTSSSGGSITGVPEPAPIAVVAAALAAFLSARRLLGSSCAKAHCILEIVHPNTQLAWPDRRAVCIRSPTHRCACARSPESMRRDPKGRSSSLPTTNPVWRSTR